MFLLQEVWFDPFDKHLVLQKFFHYQWDQFLLIEETFWFIWAVDLRWKNLELMIFCVHTLHNTTFSSCFYVQEILKVLCYQLTFLLNWFLISFSKGLSKKVVQKFVLKLFSKSQRRKLTKKESWKIRKKLKKSFSPIDKMHARHVGSLNLFSMQFKKFRMKQ